MTRNLRLACLFGVIAFATAAAGQIPVPRIVNGTPTAGFPSVGALVFYSSRKQTQVEGLCSGTLVGCHTFVTAAHCVCNGTAEDAATCARDGLIDPRTMRVFFQHAGFFDIERVVIHPDFSFAEAADIAVVKLATAPRGLAPSPLNTLQRPAPGTTGMLVGFGRTGGRFFDPDDAGLKREGPVTTTVCDEDIPDATHVCWRFLGQGSSTCAGDSGGPLFVDWGDGPVLAGTTSGGTRESCFAPDFSFNTDVFVYRSFVSDEAAEPLGVATCDDSALVEGDGALVIQRTGVVDSAIPEARLEIAVPENATELRLALNGYLFGGSGSVTESNEFDLYVGAGSPPTRRDFDCSDQSASVFGYCEIDAPQAGTWHVLIDRVAGAGEWQLTATLLATTPACVGDCNDDGLVTVDELVAGISVALGSGAASTCMSLDVDGSGAVTVDEIVKAVDNALQGCR